MMATAGFVGLSAGKRMLSSSFYYSDLAEKFSYTTDQHHRISSTKNVIIAKKTDSCNYGRPPRSYPKALKEGINGAIVPHSETWVRRHVPSSKEEPCDPDSSVEVFLLFQKSMLEKQLELSFEHIGMTDKPSRVSNEKELHVTSSGIPARLRRINSRKKTYSKNSMKNSHEKLPTATVSPELLQNHLVGYVRGVTSTEIPTHAQVVFLSQKIKAGLFLEERRSRLKEKLGCEPSDDQLAYSLRMDRDELRSKLIECTLARDKLAMSNVRLVMKIAQRYVNMGADMADLVQGGLMGLLRGIEKFESSKGFKFSTYVYWWIRQGISKVLLENSSTLRLPKHLRARISLIREAKNKLKAKGTNPTIDRIAETLNISRKKIQNATEAVKLVLSLDREPFPSLNGVPGNTYHSYIADNRLENNPWHGVDEWMLKVSDINYSIALQYLLCLAVQWHFHVSYENIQREEVLTPKLRCRLRHPFILSFLLVMMSNGFRSLVDPYRTWAPATGKKISFVHLAQFLC